MKNLSSLSDWVYSNLIIENSEIKPLNLFFFGRTFKSSWIIPKYCLFESSIIFFEILKSLFDIKEEIYISIVDTIFFSCKISYLIPCSFSKK